MALIEAAMRTKSRRRFSILDGMALTAAIAIGIAMARAMYGHDPFGWGLPRTIAQTAWAIAFPLSWAVALLRVRGSCPRFRAPGVAACAAVAVLSLCLLLFYSHNFVSNAGRIGLLNIMFSEVTLAYILRPGPFAAAVAAIWGIMRIDGRWRPEPSWIDRLGRMLGFFWLAAGISWLALNVWARASKGIVMFA
jgi:hypothetical protein